MITVEISVEDTVFSGNDPVTIMVESLAGIPIEVIVASWGPPTGGGGGGGVTDHGALTGLTDDDHSQYHTDARGDARYYTKTQIDSSLAGKENSGAAATAVSSHVAASDPHTQYLNNTRGDVRYYLKNEVDTKIADLVASSPATLDTLDELAAALGDDPNFATTMATSLGNRLRVDTAAQSLSGTQKTNAKTNIDLQNVDNTSDLAKPISTATQTALNAKENTITATTSADYYRGDKTFQPLNKAAVGLANVDNTSDLNKPISTATQAALNGKLNNPTTPVGFWSQMPTFPTMLNYFIEEYDQFQGQVANSMGMLYAVSSGGSSAVQLRDASEALAGVNATERAIGVTSLNTGSTATGRAALGFGGQQSAASLRIGIVEMIFGIRQGIHVLSTVTENFTVWVGFMDLITAAPTNGVFFRQNYNVNGGRWEFCVASGGSTTASDTGVAVTATVYQVLEIKINRAGTSATFFIDGSLVGTITTGFPTAGLLAMSSCIKSAGTTQPGIVPIDALYFATERLAVR
jgi:hypothetical protein